MVHRSWLAHVKFFGWLGPSDSQWTLGQIIAVAVWARALAKYIHLVARDIKKGFKARLANGHEVVMEPNAVGVHANASLHGNTACHLGNGINSGQNSLQVLTSSYALLPTRPYGNSSYD
ncbi:hypothetical protein LTR22_027248 [Elasticomyces elasticus]|nr:hypothetical protein LTR22_027248 [Elasticomyces elasticus]KAK4907303.1 hypothetical protein LTR49_023673 [Elasticomyces elasticus]KAK5747781.1 hypothetical protein LTS12_022180 [Elasticomyces elasticus]